MPGSLAAAVSAACCPRSSQTPLRLKELPAAAAQQDKATTPKEIASHTHQDFLR